jgi:hypothetical protein
MKKCNLRKKLPSKKAPAQAARIRADSAQALEAHEALTEISTSVFSRLQKIRKTDMGVYYTP